MLPISYRWCIYARSGPVSVTDSINDNGSKQDQQQQDPDCVTVSMWGLFKLNEPDDF